MSKKHFDEYNDSDIYDIPSPDVQPSSLTWLVWPVVFLVLALFLSAIFGV